MLPIKRILIKWFHGVVEYLIFFPIFLVIAVLTLSNHQLSIMICVLPFLMLFSLLFISSVSNKKGWVYILFSLIISTLFAMIIGGTIRSWSVLFIFGFAVCYRGIIHGQREWKTMFPVDVMWLSSLIIYFFGFFLFHYISTLKYYFNIFSWVGVLVIILAMFISNNDQLGSATLINNKKVSINLPVKQKNRYFISATILVILVLTNIHSIQTFLSGLSSRFFGWLYYIFTLLGNGKHHEQTKTGASMPSMLPGMKEARPSQFMLILEKIAIGLAYCLLVVLCFLLLFFIFKKARTLIVRVMTIIKKWFNQIFHIENKEEGESAYIDEKESIINWKDWRKNNQQRAQEWVTSWFKHPPKWDDLTNKEKIQIFYRQFVKFQMKKGTTFKLSHTPQENIDAWVKEHPDQTEIVQLADVYGQAKYGNSEISDEAVTSIESIIEKNK